MDVVEIDNYLAVWGFGGASQAVNVSLHCDGDQPQGLYKVPLERGDVDAAITVFTS